MNMISRQGAQPRPLPSEFADSQAWMGFLRPLLLVVGNPPTREDFARKCDAFAFFLKIPTEMLTTWRQQEAGARFKFFPTPAEVQEWLAPDLAARRDTAARRDVLGDTPALPAPPTQLRPERTPEEIAAARAAVQAFKAGLAETKREARSDQARPLSEGHLLAQYEALAAKGNAVAAFRAKALRARYARDLAQEAAE
jgi:Xaa-Pro aminopeptidase